MSILKPMCISTSIFYRDAFNFNSCFSEESIDEDKEEIRLNSMKSLNVSGENAMSFRMADMFHAFMIAQPERKLLRWIKVTNYYIFAAKPQ